MDTHDDTVVRMRPKSTFFADVAKPERKPLPDAEEDTGPELDAGDKLLALPQPGSAYDAAYARPHNRALPTLRLLISDRVKGLPYANLDSIDLEPGDKPGEGPVIVIWFTGIVVRQVRISGRHLEALYDYLSYHRIAWVRMLPKGRDFRDKDGEATVITGITVEMMQ